MPDHFRIGMGMNTEMFAKGLNVSVARQAWSEG
jgi:hypothetical protein